MTPAAPPIDRRNARHAQQLPVARGGIDVSLVDVLRHRRRQHEENGVTGIDFGRKHRRERQRAEPGRQLCHQECRQHEIGIGDIGVRGSRRHAEQNGQERKQHQHDSVQSNAGSDRASRTSRRTPFGSDPGEMMNEGPVSIRNSPTGQRSGRIEKLPEPWRRGRAVRQCAKSAGRSPAQTAGRSESR